MKEFLLRLLSVFVLCFTANVFAQDNVFGQNQAEDMRQISQIAFDRDYETLLELIDSHGNGDLETFYLRPGHVLRRYTVIFSRTLITASIEGDMDAVKGFIERGVMVDTRRCAYINDSFEMELGQEINYQCGTPLLMASYYNHVDLVWYLIEQGADLDNPTTGNQFQTFPIDPIDHPIRTTSGYTPLIAAVTNNNIRVAKILIDLGADLHIQSPQGTALEIAMDKGHTHIERLLRQAGAEETCQRDFIPFNC